MGVILPSKQVFTACAFRVSGTTASISFALRIWRADMEMACFGTCEIFANQASPTCCWRQVGEAWFANISQVPKQAISMSARQILKAKEILAVVPDTRKAQAVKTCFEGKITPMAPASILRTHPNATIYLDTN